MNKRERTFTLAVLVLALATVEPTCTAARTHVR